MKILVKEKNRITDTFWYETRQECVKYVQYLLKVDKHTGIKKTYKIVDNAKVIPSKFDKYVSLRSGTTIVQGYATNHETRITKKTLKKRKRDAVNRQESRVKCNILTEIQYKALQG